MTDKDEAAQAAAEAEAAASDEGGSQADDSLDVQPAEQPGGDTPADEQEEPEEETEAHPLMTVTPEMVEGGDWQEYRPSLTFRAKTMPEAFSVETKDGVVSGDAGDVVAVIGDDLHVFSSSVFAAEYQPVVHGA